MRERTLGKGSWFVTDPNRPTEQLVTAWLHVPLDAKVVRYLDGWVVR